MEKIKTTLTIDDESAKAARIIAIALGISLNRVFSTLVLRGLQANRNKKERHSVSHGHTQKD